MSKQTFLVLGLLICGLAAPASAFVFDNSVAYRWGDPFGDPTDHYMEVERGETIALQIFTNDLDGQAWVNASNGAITSVYGDGSVIDYTAITDNKAGSYYSSYWSYTNYHASGNGYWYLEYMGGSGSTRWVAEDRLIITLNLTIREDAPLGPTYIGLQQAFVWWYNFWLDKTVFFQQRIDDDNNPLYRMKLMVTNGVLGDFDGDGDVDADDIDILCANMGGDVATYDMDGDLDVDEDDMIYHVENLVELQDGSGRVGTKPGDFNLDGIVNATDLAIMNPNFGLSGQLYSDGNANCDTIINGTDLAILAGNLGFAAPTGAVPEPISLALLGIGGVALLRKRK